MLLVSHPLYNRVDVSLLFIVSQFIFGKVYISVKVSNGRIYFSYLFRCTFNIF